MSQIDQLGKAAKVQIRGRVQGVGFRYFVYKNARKNGLTGWVKNKRDGSVHAWFEGPEQQIEKMAELCKSGPAGSSVTDISIDWTEPQGTWTEFDFKYE